MKRKTRRHYEVLEKVAAIIMAKNQTEACSKCKGSGQQDIHIVANGVERTEKMRCMQCDGKKFLPLGENARIAAEWAEELKNWCDGKSCPEDVEQTFYDDGQHPGCCDKHHYHCGNCGKISQVG